MPIFGAHFPIHTGETHNAIQCVKFLPARTFDFCVAHCCRRFPISTSLSHSDSDGYRCLNVKHILRLARAQVSAFQIQQPKLIESLTHDFAHSREAWTSHVGRSGDEGDNTTIGMRFEELPQRPAPEIHIDIVEIHQMHSAAALPHRLQEIFENRAALLGRQALFVAPVAHPATLARALVAELFLLPLIRRIADANQNGLFGLHALRQLLFLDQRPVLQCQRFGRRGPVTLQSVGQINLRPPTGQHALRRLQLPGEPQMRHRIRPHHKLEAVEILREEAGALGNRTFAMLPLHQFERVLHGGDQISAGASGGIEKSHSLVGKGQRLAKAPIQQFRNQPHLAIHHLVRRIVGPGLLAKLRIVFRQKALVEMQPKLIIAPGSQRSGRCRAERAGQQIQPQADFGAGFELPQHAQHLREQRIVVFQSNGRRLGGVHIRARQAREQHGVGERLRIGIGELGIVGAGKQRTAPLPRQLRNGGFRLLQGGFHIGANHLANGREKLRQLPGAGGNHGVPVEEIK